MPHPGVHDCNQPKNMEKMMLKDSKTIQGPFPAEDLEAVSQQLAALREDMSHLAETVTGIAGRRGNRMAADIAEGFEEAKHYAASKGRAAEVQLEESVAAHPFVTIGLAAAAGFLVGSLSRR
jgi:ElaB/YqjD/DUF883 family membrane-anchored ribosome-binding protein